jgi:hypothetical protein
MSRRLGGVGLLLLLIYSCAHFFQSGMGGFTAAPEDRCRGDFLSAFPGPFVAKYNPALFNEFGAYWHVASGSDTLWNYGPALHLVTLPLTVLPNRATACPVWMLANLGFVVASAILVFRTAVRASQRSSWVLPAVYACLWLNFYPLLTVIRQGNIEIFEFFLVAVAYHSLADRGHAMTWRPSRRESLAGGSLGLAVMTKFLPVIFLPYLALKKRWRALVVASGVVVVMALLTQPLLGWEQSVTLLSLKAGIAQRVRGQGEFGRGYAHNQSLAGMVWRTASTFPNGLERTTTAWIDPARLDDLIRLVKLTVLLAMGLFAWLFIARRKTPRIHLEVPLLVAFMIFIPPWNWDYYQVFLLLPFSVLLLRYVWRAGRRRWLWGGGLAALYLATGSVILPSSFLSHLVGWPDFGLLLTMQNLSLPAWANLGLVLWQRARQPLLGHDHGGPGILQHELEPLLGVGGIQR